VNSDEQHDHSQPIAAPLLEADTSTYAREDATDPAVREADTGPTPTQTKPFDWRRAHARRMAITDFVILVWVVYGTQIFWLGLDADLVTRENSSIGDLAYWIFSALLIAGWMIALALNDSRSPRVFGNGNEKYRRVVQASLRTFGVVAILAFALQVDLARGFLLISLPLGILFLLIGRWLWRQWLLSQRARGGYAAKVLLVGSEESVTQVARELRRSPSAGYQVVGCCVPNGRIAGTLGDTNIPVMGTVNAIDRALAATGADTVVVTSTDDLPPDKVKQISWSLEQGRQHLVLAPSITDIAGPRIHLRPVAGLPLIHVETPRFSKGQRLVKRLTDIVMSVGGVIVLSPLLIALALAVRLSGPGPVLFTQTRVGYAGRTFRMLKFRSMVQGAEAQLPELSAQRDAGNEVLFKMKNDPRVTRVGRFMRKYSLDEFPQLFNVIAGSMSLVGPRPPLPSEVALYADHVHRRFLVKPGITGLWQVSGRSLLTWDDTVRLDLSYVENWSLMGDLLILGKTARAILAPGATAA
jgi:exopolysaccharide biosynthesis polyprenyl glycosylphosphotransferase